MLYINCLLSLRYLKKRIEFFHKFYKPISKNCFGWGNLGPLGRPTRRWEDIIKMDLPEVGWGSLDLVDLTLVRDRWRTLVNAVMNFRVPQNAGNVLISSESVVF